MMSWRRRACGRMPPKCAPQGGGHARSGRSNCGPLRPRQPSAPNPTPSHKRESACGRRAGSGPLPQVRCGPLGPRRAGGGAGAVRAAMAGERAHANVDTKPSLRSWIGGCAFVYLCPHIQISRMCAFKPALQFSLPPIVRERVCIQVAALDHRQAAISPIMHDPRPVWANTIPVEIARLCPELCYVSSELGPCVPASTNLGRP